MKIIREDDGSMTFMSEPEKWPADAPVSAESFGEYVRRAAERAAAPHPYQTQIGGDHYKKYKIQPIEFILANNIPYCEANVIKYVTRWKDKGGVEDLKKARHYIDLLINEASK